ncbi:ABC transporter [Wohlfahrtiimonas chitiniclastica]|uniref:ABC transporter ATP-binding protein n=1 Tax=Wohlfahrtiimonas chitiniclastica TaxID=400946 RepID=UPI0007B69B8C|nr:ABC transporter ATP-binding protein [Wohlfahrtiimonas chitiniclastica]KZX36676.1 ABC transporter [Wohlfahrtiimonas chitiniclastica]OYQ77847.1 ABC transporter [Wohlfahrtiimonas chitiniclastica]
MTEINAKQPALAIRGLAKTYHNGKVALKGIDLTVAQGDFFALLGPNGAGKSTTISIITGLLDASSGQVEIFGHDHKKEMRAAKSLVGLVPQEFNFNQFELCEDILVNQAGYFGVPRKIAKARAAKYLKLLNLSDKARVMARNLSGGMKRRLLIARALMHEPKLLILDEPTAGVDIEIRRQTWELLQEINATGTTIILTTHYLEEAELLCKNIAIISHGEIIEHCSMDHLLRQLQSEAFVLSLHAPLTEAPKAAPGIDFRLLNEMTLEAEITKPHTISEVFNTLNAQNIQVETLRNRANRLEELFIKLTGNHEDSHE